MGKSVFMHLFDGEDKLQIYIRKDMVSEKDFAVNNLLDIGDIIGVKGTVFKTHTQELSVLVSAIDFPGQVVPPAAGKMARPAGQGTALPPALPGPDRQSRKPRMIFRKRSQIIQSVSGIFSRPRIR